MTTTMKPKKSIHPFFKRFDRNCRILFVITIFIQCSLSVYNILLLPSTASPEDARIIKDAPNQVNNRIGMMMNGIDTGDSHSNSLITTTSSTKTTQDNDNPDLAISMGTTSTNIAKFGRNEDLHRTESMESPSDKKQSLCTNHHVVYDQIHIAKKPTFQNLKILCFIMTHSNSHATKIKAIQSTWGKRCDKLIIASNVTDSTYGTLSIGSDSSYLGLWKKLNETMQYVWDHYRNDGYDWVYKVDDDTYVIMENLKHYLSSPAVLKKKVTNGQQQQQQPLIFGRRYSSPRYRDLAKRAVYFANPINEEFGKRFYNKVNKHRPVIYNYGGPGYVMNWFYVETFLNIMKSPDTVHGTPPEDQAHGVVMAYHDIWPQNTRDEMNRERFHPENPEFMYSMSDEYRKLWNDNHKTTGGISVGQECCSERSIAFHHINPNEMRKIEQILYDCRGL